MTGNSAIDNIQRGYGLGTLFSNTDQNAYTKALQGVDSSYYTPEVSKAISQGYDNLAGGGGNQESGMFGGLGSYMDKLGVTGPEGQLFGLSKDQQAGLGQLAGLGSGVWNMYNADRQYGMMKDYYGKQMELQDKQMARVDKEDARMEGMRSGLAKNY